MSALSDLPDDVCGLCGKEPAAQGAKWLQDRNPGGRFGWECWYREVLAPYEASHLPVQESA